MILAGQLPPALAERARSREASGHSVVYVGWGGQVRALLSLDDSPLPEARATVAALRGRGLEVALLTGDLGPAAERIASMVQIDSVQAGLSPEAKRVALDRYRQEHGMVAMVGDGLNDGPVLAAADIGIAVGSATDLARETAAVVLPAGRIVDAAVGHRRGSCGAHDHPHQPRLGVRLQPRRSDFCRARTSQSDPCSGGHGRLEHPRGHEFAAARTAARILSRRSRSSRREPQSRRAALRSALH